MNAEQKYLTVLRLRDVAQIVSVCGKTDTYPFPPQIIEVICEMQTVSEEWLNVLNNELKHMEPP